MKRFYSDATVAAEADGAWQVLLDGRQVRTPKRTPVTLPSRDLAEAVAEEWASQGETIDPAAMHLTALASTGLDQVAPDPGPVIGLIVDYAQTDLVCYRAEEPADLARREERMWQPLLDWIAAELDAPLAVTHGIVPVTQPQSSLRTIQAAIADHDALRLAALRNATEKLGSAVLGLALDRGRLTAGDAVAAAHVDEDYQAELWGRDAEAEDRRQRLAREVAATERFLRLLDPAKGR